jgi:WD40 repeat protein
VQGAIEQLFQSANSGKTAIAGAIGSPATSSDTFAQLAGLVTTGKGQIATATGNTSVNSSSTFQQLSDAVAALSASDPTFGIERTVTYDETIAKGDVVESYYRTLAQDLLTFPTTVPVANCNGISWSPDNVYLAVAHDSSTIGGVSNQRASIYKRTGDTFTRLSTPTSVDFSSNSESSHFSSDGNYVVFATGGSTNSIRVFKRSGDTFTWLNSAFTQHPAASTSSCKFSPDTNFLAAAHGVNTNTEAVSVYSRNGDTFTKLTITGGQPVNVAEAVEWSGDSQYLFVGSRTDLPTLRIYKRTGTSIQELNNVFDSLPTTSVLDISQSPDQKYLALATLGAPYIYVYKKINNESYQLLSDPAIYPTGNSTGVSWSADSIYVTVTHSNSPFFTTYKLKNDALTKQQNVSQLPTSGGLSADWSSDSNYLALANRSGTGARVLSVFKNNSTTHLFSKANTDSINPLDKIIGLAKENGSAGQTKTVDVLVGRSLLP